MGGVVTEQQAIYRAHYLDLVYSQSRSLYDLIPHAPHPRKDPSWPTAQPSVDGLVGLFKKQLESKSSGELGQLTSINILVGQNVETPAKTTEVNSVQSSSSPGKKNKGKPKKKPIQQENTKNQNRNVDPSKRKVKFPCLIFQRSLPFDNIDQSISFLELTINPTQLSSLGRQ